MSVKIQTVFAVWARDRYKCRGCRIPLILGSDDFETKGELHHVYFKSQYKKNDRDESRNLALLCCTCHRGDKGVHGTNKELDKQLKASADGLKPKEERSQEKVARVKHCQTDDEKQKARNFAKLRRQKQMDEFKQKNGGLSPSQLAYRKQKEFLSRIKK